MYIYIITNLMNLVNKNLIKGSSFLSPAHECGGARATIKNNNSPSAKKSGEARKQAGKKEGGLGEGIFARLLCPPKAGWGWESVSAVPALAGRQNRKIFVSFRRSEAEAGGKTLGGIQSAKSSGFCSKKVRISSNRHHHIELVASLGALLDVLMK